MKFPMDPPEINSLRMFSGPGSGPMLAASQAWDGLAEELAAAAKSFSSVTTTLAGQAWQGPASTKMSAAAVPYATWLDEAAARATEASGQATRVAGVFETTKAAMIPPLAVEANRDAFVQLVLSNIFGQNATVIAAIEDLYEQMWAQDVDAMIAYLNGASESAAKLPAWQQAPPYLRGLPPSPPPAK